MIHHDSMIGQLVLQGLASVRYESCQQEFHVLYFVDFVLGIPYGRKTDTSLYNELVMNILVI